MLLALAGLLSGIVGGFFGIGGGIIIVPILVIFFNFSQKLAQGTTLAALIPPIGLLAAFAYWKTGNVNLKAALIIAVGFLIGGWIGGFAAQYVPEFYLRKFFAVMLVLVAIKLFLQK